MNEKFERIAELIMGGQFDSAQKELDRLSPTDDPSRAEHLYLQGFAAEKQHDWERCAELYEQALALDPAHTETLFRLAYVSDLLGEDERAIELYERCTREAPAHVNALMNLAVIFEDHERFDEAAECLECVLDQHPNHLRARLFLRDVQDSLTMYYDEDQERTRDRRNALMDVPVTDFELSVRSRNCLKQMDIRTLGDLLAISEPELLGYKNFGETSLNEIKVMLAQKNLRLGQNSDQARKEALAPAAPKAVTVGDQVILQRTVSELELSVRSRKCLQRLGISTLGELAARSEAELLAIKNFGQTSLVEIKQRLNAVGLSLRTVKR